MGRVARRRLPPDRGGRRTVRSGAQHEREPLLALQRRIGNRATTALLGTRGGPVQRQARGDARGTDALGGRTRLLDFCPGTSGSGLEQDLTIPLSRLEATGWAADVPWEVSFTASKSSRLSGILTETHGGSASR